MVSKKKSSKKSAPTTEPTTNGSSVDVRMSNTDIEHTWEGILLVEYTDSNPVGNLNAAGSPKIDPIDGRALVSGESLRRKSRNYVMGLHLGQAPYDILIRTTGSMERDDGGRLTFDDKIQSSREAAGFGKSEGYLHELKTGSKGKKDKMSEDHKRQLQQMVCQQHWDARVYGFVGTVGNSPIEGCKGPLVISDGESLHPVVDIPQTNTRKMVVRESEKQQRNQSIGNRTVLRYALIQHMFTLSPMSASITRMSMADFCLALDSLLNCWTQDAAPHRRGVVRGLWLFKQPKRGRRPVPHDWDDIVRVTCKLDEPVYASSFSDFNVEVDQERLQKFAPGVEILDLPQIQEMIDLHLDRDLDEAAE